MIRTCLFALALSCATTVQAQNSAPTDYELAVQARLAGDAARAADLLEPLVAADPHNSDAQVQLGLARMALGELDAAEAAFRAALAVAPGYTDAHVGLARIAQRRGDNAAALRALDAAGVQNAEIAELRRQLADAPSDPRWKIDVDAAYSWIDGPQPDWRELAFQLRRSEGRAAIGARVEYARRFDRDDVYGEAQIDYRLSDAARLYATLGGTPDADFRPKWQLGLGGSLRVNGGLNATVLTLDGRQARFVTGDVQSLSPGIEQYLGGRFWLTGRWINLFDERGTHRSGYFVRGDVQASEALRLFAGYSDAPDTDEGVVVDVRSLFGGVSLDLGRRHSFRLAIAHDDRATGADRTQLTVGFGLRF
ncbi:YaiO family outer membrane beta-barrel protein [Sphingopyxis indica]|uniref:YaiO family outer membrane beta-barrel protein n=1 Tax=Sphingopyxis indica TaxID=436663 RepID=UPI0029394E7F|nr:YaiO family outer membrane beta-barrel protein [Sphingopyxis indica]WOF42405.1 YaiO family outer membrane beta-barrel protein [Sphingopyxis indica]